jgi:very-short-patch-repair endonuclease
MKRGIVMGQHNPVKRERAKTLRKEHTSAENLMWQYLRGNRLDGFHFRRQQVIDGFIAAFYCHEAGIIIELDGSIHESQTEYDTLRERILSA